MQFLKPTLPVLPSVIAIVTALSFSNANQVIAGANPENTESSNELNLNEARQYMLFLINRDRKSQNMSPVVLDPIATKSGQMHSDEMAQYGYLSHWDLSGTKPDQRYTQVGGQAAVAENAYFLGFPEKQNQEALSPNQVFSKAELEQAEERFFSEKPPNDGHRKNILEPKHNAVGLGLSVAGDPDNRRVAITQEFSDNYGIFTQLPEEISLGDHFNIAGKLDSNIKIHSIDLRWENFPTPMTLQQVKETYSYAAPREWVKVYWPTEHDIRTNTPGVLSVKNSNGSDEFNMTVVTDNTWKPGLYYVFIWGKQGIDEKPFVISRRTVEIN